MEIIKKYVYVAIMVVASGGFVCASETPAEYATRIEALKESARQNILKENSIPEAIKQQLIELECKRIEGVQAAIRQSQQHTAATIEALEKQIKR